MAAGDPNHDLRMRGALLVHGAGGGGWEWNIWRAVLAAEDISAQDDEVPPALIVALAADWHASLLRVRSPSHVGPLLGRGAASVAAQAAAWLSAR